MFYNVENLFDTFDDPATADDEFTPNGDKKWTPYRYSKKLNNIAKTIIAVGGWEPPAIIGLCEVENFQVLLDLTTKTALKAYNYQIIHENSRDLRGIDNAILFRNDRVNIISQKSIPIELDAERPTRDLLYTSFLMPNHDTIHFFINHWPSRFGGKEVTEKKRIVAARRMKETSDSLLSLNINAKVFIMGDFNDEPSDISLSEILGVKTDIKEVQSGDLYNLSAKDFHSEKGTLVYKEINYSWFLFDQMIVSDALLSTHGYACKDYKNSIFMPDWLLKKERPFRTYQGPIYQGGFSDHLPIFIDLYYDN